MFLTKLIKCVISITLYVYILTRKKHIFPSICMNDTMHINSLCNNLNILYGSVCLKKNHKLKQLCFSQRKSELQLNMFILCRGEGRICSVYFIGFV